jgi:hypothetical protein
MSIFWMKYKSISTGALSMWLQTVKFIAKKSKFAGLAHEIGFSAPSSCSLRRLVKGTAIQLCTSKKECNKLHLTAAQYFWLVDHMIGPGGSLLVVPHVYAVPVSVLLVGCQKQNS